MLTRSFRRPLGAVALLLSTACGGDDGPTDREAPVTTPSSPGGPLRAPLPSVALTANEPATIYYTVDGTEPTTAGPSGASPVTVASPGARLRFFAVDAAGNAEVPREVAWAIDRLGPAAVDAFVATASDAAVALSWRNPTAPGFAEVVIARIDDAGAAVPIDGTGLAVGDTFAGGEVLYVGTGETTTMPAATGTYTFAAVARYGDTGTYSEPRFASDAVTSSQVGQITISNTGVATVTSPPGYTIGVSNVVGGAFFGLTTTWTFDLSLTSDVGGAVFNPKLILNTVSGVTLPIGDGTPTSGPYANKPYWHFGPHALAPGATVTRSVTARNADSAITLDVEVVTNPGFYAFGWNDSAGSDALIDPVVDRSSPGALAAAPDFTQAVRAGLGGYRGAVVTPDGRYLIAGTRNTPTLSKLDLSSGAAVATLTVAVGNGTGALSHCDAAPSATRLYCVLNDGMHTYASFENDQNIVDDLTTQGARPVPPANAVYLVEIDPIAMTETRRLSLFESPTALTYRGGRVRLSADGRQAVVAGGAPYTATNISTVHLIDLATWTLRDGDAATPGHQGLSLGMARPSECVFDGSGAHVLCNSSSNDDTMDQVPIVDVADLSVRVVDLDGVAATADERAVSFLPLPDGDVLALMEETNGGYVRIDPATATARPTRFTASTAGARVGAVLGDVVLLRTYSAFEVVDLATGATLLAGNAGDTSYDHNIAVTPF